MKIRFLGHASFLITSDQGTRVITDPYRSGCFDGGIGYGPITEEADIVTISHEHDDHNETSINGRPEFVRGPGRHKAKGISIEGTPTFHDAGSGQDRGKNTAFKILMDGMDIVHLGDLGHTLSADDVTKIAPVDVLFVPVGGYFTIDAQSADKVIKDLQPKVVIPMHFKTDKCGFPIAPVDDFTRGRNVKTIEGDLEIRKEGLPEETTIYVMQPAK